MLGVELVDRDFLPRQHVSGQDTEPEAGAWQGWVSDLNFSESGWWCRILSNIEIEMYHVSHQDQQFGPYTVEQINEYLAQGAFDASYHVWDANANGWVEIKLISGVVLPAQAHPPQTPPSDSGSPAPLTPQASFQKSIDETDHTGSNKSIKGGLDVEWYFFLFCAVLGLIVAGFLYWFFYLSKEDFVWSLQDLAEVALCYVAFLVFCRIIIWGNIRELFTFMTDVKLARGEEDNEPEDSPSIKSQIIVWVLVIGIFLLIMWLNGIHNYI